MARKTYADVMRQIQQLQEEAERLKQEEVDGVIARIRQAVEVYQLSPADVFGKQRGAGASKPGGRRTPATKRAHVPGGIQFSDGNGNTWGGRGPRPRWLRDALAGGASLEAFRIGAGDSGHPAISFPEEASQRGKRTKAAKKAGRSAKQRSAHVSRGGSRRRARSQSTASEAQPGSEATAV